MIYMYNILYIGFFVIIVFVFFVRTIRLNLRSPSFFFLREAALKLRQTAEQRQLLEVKKI